jgi:hypothetical protein
MRLETLEKENAELREQIKILERLEDGFIRFCIPLRGMILGWVVRAQDVTKEEVSRLLKWIDDCYFIEPRLINRSTP